MPKEVQRVGICPRRGQRARATPTHRSISSRTGSYDSAASNAITIKNADLHLPDLHHDTDVLDVEMTEFEIDYDSFSVNSPDSDCYED